MKMYLKRLAFIHVFACMLGLGLWAQPQLSVPDYTSCPGQVITGLATWNNASSITYSLYGPPNGPAGMPLQTWGPNIHTFPVSHPGAAPNATVITYTVIARGIYQGVTTTVSTVFSLNVIPPASILLTTQTDYCNGSTATILAPTGGNIYNYTLTGMTGSSPSNVITIPNLQPNHTGNIFVSSVIGGCTVTGQAPINVSPFTVFAISGAANVCQGSGANACVTLTSNLPGGNAYQWYDNFNNPIAGANGQNLQVGAGTPPNCNISINHAGVYRVTAETVFNTVTCPYSATTQVNVVQTNPVSASASPGNVICQGSNLNLSASAGGIATSWSWVGPGFSSGSANPILSSVLPSHSGDYTVTAFFQSFITCSTTAVLNVSVVPIALPAISMPADVCQGDDFVVTGSSIINPFSYSWSGPLFSGGVPSSGATVPVTNVPLNASGTQYLTVIYSIGATQCPVTSSVQLNVVPVNPVTVIPPTPVCSPKDAFLQALATGANQYLWTGPNGFSTQGANVWVNHPNPSASGVYSVTALFGSGGPLVCSSSNTVELEVYPVMNFTLIPRQQICYNTPFSLNGPPGATSYTWTSSSGFESNTRDIFINSAQPNNAGTYTLNVSVGPCVTSAESELVVLTPLSFTLTPFDRTICRGDTIFLEGGATGGSENYAYEWNPSVYLGSSTGQLQMAVPLGSVLYNLIVHDIACPNYTIAHPFMVNVNQPPQPKLELPQGAGCAPLCLFYDSKTKGESAITTYDFGGTRVMQRDSFMYCLDTPGTYTLKIHTKGRNGCSGDYQYPYPIVVNPSPGADVHWTPEVPTTNDEIAFYPTFKTEPVSHLTWNFLGGVTDGDTTMNNLPGVSDTTNIRTPKRFYEQFGDHPVVLIAQNDHGCVDTVYKIVKVIDDLQIYVPNAFTPNGDGINDLFMVKGSGMRPEGFTMDIFSRAGINLFTTNNINEGWDGKYRGEVMKDATYVYKIRVVGMNGEGRKEITGYFSLLK